MVKLVNNNYNSPYLLGVRQIQVANIFTEKVQKIRFKRDLRHETETRPRHFVFSPRRDRDQDPTTFSRDRTRPNIGKVGLETVSRPRRRDRDNNPAL